MNIKHLYKASFIILLILFTNSILAQGSEWALKKNNSGIIIHTRKNTTTGYIEFKASTTIETSIKTLLDIFYDIENYKKWMADTKESKILKKISNNEQYIYIEAQTPWPLENRDIPLHQEFKKTNNGTIITLTGKPNYIPQKQDITRIEKAIGSWELIQLQNSKVKVIYRFMADPGLNIPNWVINLFIVDGPYKTLTNLKAIVQP